MRIRSTAYILATFAGIAGVFSQGKNSDQHQREYSLSEPRFEKITVANIGPIAISAQEFLMSYEFGPAFPKRERESKSRYLNYMVYEKLLALDGEAKGLLKAPDAKRLLGEIEADLATEEMYRDKIATRVRIPEARIARGIARTGEHIKLQWIYSNSQEEIAATQAALNRGAGFDSLFARQFNDSVKTDDRTMECTRFKLDGSNPLLSSVADTLGVGHISLPIHTPDGWYLIRLSNGTEEAIVTETELAKRREDVHRALVQQVSDSLSDRFVDSLMRNSAPVIERKALDIVEAYLAEKVQTPETFAAWNLKSRLVDRWGKTASGDIQSHFDDVLVTMKHGAYHISDMIHWYEAREQVLKFPTTTPERFHGVVEQLAWRMARDRILTDNAMKAGLQNRKTVRQQKQWWKEKVAYLLNKGSFMDSISVTDDALRQYYSAHPADFRDDSGKTRALADVKDDIRKQITDSELTKRMLHRILALKQKYHITIHEDALKQLYVDTENQPTAIDVYPVKKGGIFPHRAFPSIDYEWQSWE